MARESFRPTPRDRNHMHEIATDGVDGVMVDLNKTGKDAIEIVEVDDTPEGDRGRDTEWRGPSTLEEQEADLRGVSTRTQKRIGRMKAEIETERRGRSEAQRQLDAAAELIRAKDAEIERMRRGAETGATALATSMKAEREARIADAERRLTQAHADGDSAAIAAATKDLGAAQAELVAITARTPAPRTEPEPRPQQQPAPQQQDNLAPNVRNWIDHNRGWFQKPGNEQKTSKAMSIHYDLVASNIMPASPEYTRELDKRLAKAYPDHMPYGTTTYDDDDRDRGNGSPPRRSNAVDRGSRDDGAGAERPRNQVELTSSEVSLANRLRIPLEKYAAEKQKREGRGKGA